MGMCTRRVEPGNAHTLAGNTVPPLALCKKVRKASVATRHGKATGRKQVHLPECIRVHWYGLGIHNWTRIDRKAWSKRLPSLKERPFTIDYVMNEPSPKCLVRTIDTETIIINGYALLLKKVGLCALDGSLPIFAAQGGSQTCPANHRFDSCSCHAFCEREIVQQI